MKRLLEPAVLLFLALHINFGRTQTCGNTSPDSRGAARNGVADDTNAILALENDGSVGVIYLTPGTYRITRSITLRKPIIGAGGSVLSVDGGATLVLENQPEHPPSLFFVGGGSVKFGYGTQMVLPEWFGAAGNGVNDDSFSIQRAYDAARAFGTYQWDQPVGSAMLYLRGVTYGIGPATQLLWSPGVEVVSEPRARFKSIGGQPRGITLVNGNFGAKSAMPHLEGFSEACITLEGVSLAAVNLKTLTNCGDAIRLRTPGPNIHLLDNTVWFDKIINSRYGITFRAEVSNCWGAACIFQGNHIVGGDIIGGAASGATHAIFFNSWAGPAWDSNKFELSVVQPNGNPEYRVMQCWPQCDKEVLEISTLHAIPAGGKIFGSGKMNMMDVNIRLTSPLPENGVGISGELNVLDIVGAVTPPNTAVRLANGPNSKASFNGGRALVGAFHTLHAYPTSDWPSGEARQFWFYHQYANGVLYQFKCNAPRNGQGLPRIDCLQFNDNNNNEVTVWLINQSGGTVRAGTPAGFTIALQTLGNPG